jgi:hypothetical protein
LRRQKKITKNPALKSQVKCLQERWTIG